MDLYLDYASTSPVAQECIDDFNNYISFYSNPSSHYSSAGFRAYQILEESRKKIADYIHAKPEEIYFTSGSTESINWAIRGFLENAESDCGYLMCTPLEHPAVYNTMMYCKDFYHKLFDFIPVDKVGAVDLDRFRHNLMDAYVYNPLVAVIMVNNEIGTVNDIKSIANEVHKIRNGTLLVDATQAICHVPIDVEKMGIDMMVMSGHKIGAFSGSGFLYVRDGVKLNNLMYGGHQEKGRRPGTENFLYDVVLANQIERLAANEKERWDAERTAITKLSVLIARICNHDEVRTHINGPYIGAKRTPNNLNITIKGVDNQKLISLLNEQGITISAGSACSSSENKPSRILKNIGLSDSEARNTIRLSVNGGLTDDELNYFERCFRSAISVLL